MATREEILIQIKGDVQSLKKSMREMSSSTKKGTRESKKHFKEMEGSVGGVSDKFAKLRGVMLKVTAAIGTIYAAAKAIMIMKNMADMAGKAEVQNSKLANAVRNVGIVTGMTAAQIEKGTRALIRQAETLQTLSGYSDEEIKSAQAMLATFQLLPEQIEQITPRLLDMAASMEKSTGQATDMQSIAIALGKGFTGLQGQLSRYGVILSAEAKRTGDFNLILLDLDKNFKGAAETLGTTYVGKQRLFQQTLGDTQELMGAKVIPMFEDYYDIGIEILTLIGKLISENEEYNEMLRNQRKAYIDLHPEAKTYVEQLQEMAHFVTEAEVASIYFNTTMRFSQDIQHATGDEIKYVIEQINYEAKAMLAMLEIQGAIDDVEGRRQRRLTELEKMEMERVKRLKGLSIPTLGDLQDKLDAVHKAMEENAGDIAITIRLRKAEKKILDEIMEYYIQTQALLGKPIAIRMPELPAFTFGLDTEAAQNKMEGFLEAMKESWDYGTLDMSDIFTNIMGGAFDMMATEYSSLLTNSIFGVEDAFSKSFDEILADFGKMVVQMTIKLAILKGLSFIPGIGGMVGILGMATGGIIKAEKGLIHAQHGLMADYYGVVHQPTIMTGEKGAELITPLDRFWKELDGAFKRYFELPWKWAMQKREYPTGMDTQGQGKALSTLQMVMDTIGGKCATTGLKTQNQGFGAFPQQNITITVKVDNEGRLLTTKSVRNRETMDQVLENGLMEGIDRFNNRIYD